MWPSRNHDDSETRSLSDIRNEITATVSQPGPSRVWISLPVGSGVTTAILSGIQRRISTTGEARVLVVCLYRAIRDLWVSRLRDLLRLPIVNVDAQEYRRLELISPKESSVWGASGVYVTTSALLLAHQRTRDLLTVGWDLVVIEDMPINDQIRRGALANSLWSSPVVVSAVAVSSEAMLKPPLLSPMPTKLIEWRLTEFSQIPRIKIEAATFRLSQQERLLREKIATAVSSMALPAQRRWNALMNSSPFAVSRELTRIASPPAISGLSAGMNHPIALENGPSQDQSRGFDVRTHDDLLACIDEVEFDSKLELLRKLITSGRLTGTIVIFTEFLATAEYVAASLQSDVSAGELPLPNVQIALVSRHSPYLHADTVPNLGSIERIIVTASSALIGIELPANATAVHYDIPTTQDSAWVRMTRVRDWNESPHIVLVAESSDLTAVQQMFDFSGENAL